MTLSDTRKEKTPGASDHPDSPTISPAPLLGTAAAPEPFNTQGFWPSSSPSPPPSGSHTLFSLEASDILQHQTRRLPARPAREQPACFLPTALGIGPLPEQAAECPILLPAKEETVSRLWPVREGNKNEDTDSPSLPTATSSCNAPPVRPIAWALTQKCTNGPQSCLLSLSLLPLCLHSSPSLKPLGQTRSLVGSPALPPKLDFLPPFGPPAADTQTAGRN